ALQEVVVAAVGAQWTARPTFRFMERFDFLLTAHGTVSWLAWRSRPRPPSPAASSPGVSPPGSASSETLDELAGRTPAQQGGSKVGQKMWRNEQERYSPFVQAI